MVKFIALVSLTVVAYLIEIGNYWFTFGLWPKSFVSLFTFALLNVIISSASNAVINSKD